MPLYNPFDGSIKRSVLALPTAWFAIACAALVPLHMAAASEADQSSETLELAELEPAEIQLSDQEAAAWRAQTAEPDSTAAQSGASKGNEDRRSDGATTGPIKR